MCFTCESMFVQLSHQKHKSCLSGLVVSCQTKPGGQMSHQVCLMDHKSCLSGLVVSCPTKPGCQMSHQSCLQLSHKKWPSGGPPILNTRYFIRATNPTSPFYEHGQVPRTPPSHLHKSFNTIKYILQYLPSPSHH